MAMFGKRGLTGSAVLDAPATSHVRDSEWPIPEPAPAGTLQRRRLQAEDADEVSARNSEDTYKPRRESTVHRIRVQLLTTVAGRIVGGTLLVLGAGAVAACVFGVRNSLLHDPRFVVASSSEIQISGNHHLTRAQVLSVFGADLERNIFKIPLAERRSNLERLPWVESAAVERLLPNALRVVVTERTPVAYYREGTQIGLVDASGTLLDMPQDVAGDPHYSFPVLTGLATTDPVSVRAARMEVYHRFMKDLDSGGDKLTESLSEVDVSNPEDVKAVVTSNGMDVLVHFGDESFRERYKTFAQNLPQWKAQYPKLASVDTRYENQTVLEMQAGAPVPVTDGAAGDAPGTVAPAGQPEAKATGASSAKKVHPLANKPVAKPKAKPAPVKKPILVHAYTPESSR